MSGIKKLQTSKVAKFQTSKLANPQGLHNERHQEVASQAGGGCRSMKALTTTSKIQINKFKETNLNAKMKRSFDLHCTMLQSQCK